MDKFLQLLVTGFVLGCVYGLIALGYSLIYKASGMLSFVQGDVLTLGAFLGLTFYGTMGLPFWLSFILTVAISFFAGILFEKGVIKKLQDKNVLPIYIVLATIATSYIIQNAMHLTWGSITLYFPPIFKSIKNISVFKVTMQMESIMCVIISAFSMFILHLFMTKSRLGTAMRASAMDPLAAEACGINVSLSTGVTWGIASGMAAISGMLLGPIYGVFTMLGANYGKKAFAGAVMGGYGNMYGAMVGGILLGIVENLTSGYISSAYKNLVAYCLLIVFLFLKPTGLFNERAIHDS